MSDRGKRRAGDILLATCIDRNYLNFVEVLAASIAWNAVTRRRIVFHVFYMGEPSPDSERLARYRAANLEIRLHHADNPWTDSPTGSRFPPSVYLRMSLPELLGDEKRVIYFDADVIVLSDLARLYDARLGDAPMGGVVDTNINLTLGDTIRTKGFTGTLAELLRDVVGVADPAGYINTGMQVMDLERLRAIGYVQRCMDNVQANGLKYQFVDQDVTNSVLAGQIRLLDPRWNVLPFEYTRRRYNRGTTPAMQAISRRQRRDAWIIHFAGPKPWVASGMAGGHLFWHYADLSPAGPQLRERFGDAIYRHIVADPPWWAPWAHDIATMRYWLRQARRLPRRLLRPFRTGG